MHDLLAGSCWALESKYFSIVKAAILARLDAGLPALDASESKPRAYAHVDAQGYPTMWVTQAGELAGVQVQPQGHGLNLASGIASVLAGRSGGNGTDFKFSGEGFTHVPYYYTAALPV